MTSATTWWKCKSCEGIIPERFDVCSMCGVSRFAAEVLYEEEWELREELEAAITRACAEAGYHFGIGEGCPAAARAALAWFTENRARLDRLEDNMSLEKLFRDGEAPTFDQMAEQWSKPNEWWVTMLSGPIPNLRRFDHRKQFVHIGMGETVIGANIMWDDFRWGYFKLETGTSPLDGKPVLLINYQQPSNRLPITRIRDHVRTTKDPDKMIGRFHLHLFGEDRFAGHFELQRRPLPEKPR